MKIKLGELRQIIRSAIAEAAGGITLPKNPVIRNAMGPELADREQIAKMSATSIVKYDELSPHLKEPIYDEEDTWGPVPPTGNDPYVMPDPYSKDYHVIPTPQIKR
jgi:hypothetical protein